MLGYLTAFARNRILKAVATPADDAARAEDAGPTQPGLISGTRIATTMGWRPVEAIMPGDKVLTFDSGLQPVTHVTRQRLWDARTPCPDRYWPIEVPAGVLGNRDAMELLPHQGILVESDTAEDIYGDPFSIIPAEAAEGLDGVHRVPPADTAELVCLHFATDQLVFGKAGALFFCPALRDMLGCDQDMPQDPLYSILPIEEARFLAARINQETARQTSSPGSQMPSGVPA